MKLKIQFSKDGNFFSFFRNIICFGCNPSSCSSSFVCFQLLAFRLYLFVSCCPLRFPLVSRGLHCNKISIQLLLSCMAIWPVFTFGQLFPLWHPWSWFSSWFLHFWPLQLIYIYWWSIVNWIVSSLIILVDFLCLLFRPTCFNAWLNSISSDNPCISFENRTKSPWT